MVCVSVAAGEMGFIPVCILASMDENGVVGKPFLLPQENPWEYYDRLVYSYNVPDFTSESVKLERRKVERGIVSRKRVPVKVR